MRFCVVLFSPCHCVIYLLKPLIKASLFIRIPEKSVESPDGGYEAPDAKVVKEFMESRKKEHQRYNRIYAYV